MKLTEGKDNSVVLFLSGTLTCCVVSSGAQALEVGSVGLLHEEGLGLPCADTVSSRWIQPTHCRARLSPRLRWGCLWRQLQSAAPQVERGVRRVKE